MRASRKSDVMFLTTRNHLIAQTVIDHHSLQPTSTPRQQNNTGMSTETCACLSTDL